MSRWRRCWWPRWISIQPLNQEKPEEIDEIIRRIVLDHNLPSTPDDLLYSIRVQPKSDLTIELFFNSLFSSLRWCSSLAMNLVTDRPTLMTHYSAFRLPSRSAFCFNCLDGSRTFVFSAWRNFTDDQCVRDDGNRRCFGGWICADVKFIGGIYS